MKHLKPDIIPDFAERLRRERCAAGLTQAVAAELCGIERRTWARYEAGERLPTVDTLFYMADVLMVSTDALLGRKEWC